MNYINGLSKMEKKGGERRREGKAESKEDRMHVKISFTSEFFSNIEEKIG